MIVCSCRRVSDRLIAQVLRDGARTLEQVASSTGATTGCGGCRGSVSRLVEEPPCDGRLAAK